MAEVASPSEVETNSVLVTKTVENKVVDGSTEVQDEAPVVNGVHKEDEPTESAAKDPVPEVNGVKENGEISNAEGHDAVEADAVVDAPTDEVKEAEEPPAPPKVILHQFPRGKEIPSLSPFCLKIETFLKINDIPYDNQFGYKTGRKGKLPWVEYNGESQPDPKFAIEFLAEKFDANLDSTLTAEQSAVGRAVSTMLEENTYWVLVYNRYLDNFNEFKKIMAQGAGIGFNVSQKMHQRKMSKDLDGHGLARNTKEEVYKIAEEDIKALSVILGDKDYIMGENISTFDCTVFGLCANILYSSMDTPMKTFLKDNAQNVCTLCDKIKDTYWPDWTEVVEAEKVEPALKKGFSFRKKKTKAPKKETPAEEAETPAADTPAAAEETENGSETEKPSEEEEKEPEQVAEAPTEETPAVEVAEETPAVTEPKDETPETNGEDVKETEPTTEA